MPDPLTTSLAAPAAPSAPAAAAPTSPERAARLRTIGAALRTHWFFTLVFAVGLTGRVLTMVAYRPALLYIDSFGYLANSGPLRPTGAEPVGYPLMLKLLLDVGDFTFVAAVQHLLGLAIGVCVYVLMVRHRMPKTVAALASMPVLLDAYEWEIEQNLLTDCLFLVMITAALTLLTWRHRPGPWLAAGAGLILGAAVAVRAVGEAALVPALLFVLLGTGPSWRRRLKVTAAFVVAGAVPLVSYSIYAATYSGPAIIRASNSVMLYGRTSTIADCASLPADLKPLCPSGTVSDRQRLGPDFYSSSHTSPYFTVAAATGQHAPENAAQFSRYVIEHQPLRFAEAVGHDFLELFISPHGEVSGGTAVARWQFQTAYPEFPPLQAAPEMAKFGQSAPAVNTGVAQLLRDYQLGGGYTPNVLYAIFLLAGLGGALGLTRSARRSGLRAKCALWTSTGVVLLLAADVFEFSWRYQLPALVTLPIGGAYGIAALLGFGRMWPPMRAYPEPSDEAAVADFRERYGADFALAPIVVLIAAYNEADAIGSVIDDLPDECLGMAVKPLIVVDGATDDTARISIEHGAPTCVLPVNRGQGAALRVGYHLAHAAGARYIVTSDGDGQYDAGELPRLLAPLLEDSADLVIGSRVLGGRENRDLVRHAGVRFFGFCVTKLTGTKVTDTSSGWRAMRAQVPVNVRLTQSQYQTSEFLIGALAKGYRVADVPMSMRLRSHGSTKKGNNLVFGTRYARVVLGTWLREWVWGRTRRRVLGRGRSEVRI
ncbi:glycosyltransferase family 2 protein [Actinospica robiniae]|uniref:glycosyltransferase family 2 protein n=1 Tax=Actinospica robiniae TaxID=304901 RepID=UPI000686A16B|nr:glycosyltransferase family 2 protein [Actinospica robiniae]